MFAFLLKLLGGGAIGTIAEELRKANADRLNAQNDQQRIDADRAIAALEAKRDVLVAESNSPINKFVRAAIAAPTIVLLWKVEVYDKALGEWTGGHTDAIPSDLWTVVTVVLSFYFVTDWLKRT